MSSGARKTIKHPLMSPAPGTERHLVIHRYGDPGARPKIYLQAALHADEWPGIIALQKLIPLLDAAAAEGRIRGEILVVPYANPIGLAQRVAGRVVGRYAAEGTGNFNRDWPNLAPRVLALLQDNLVTDPEAAVAQVRGALREAVSEMPRRTPIEELRALLLSLSIDSDHVLDLHCDNDALLHSYSNYRHEANAMALSAALSAPVAFLENEAGGGAFDEANSQPWYNLKESLGDAVGSDSGGLPLACYGVTVELRGEGDVSEEYAAQDAAGLLAFIEHTGAVEGAGIHDFGHADDPQTLQSGETESFDLAAVDLLRTPAAGILGYHVELGARVKKGDVIATLYDPAADDPETAKRTIAARNDGLVVTRLLHKVVVAGDTIAKVAGTEPLAHRQSGALLDAR